MTVFTRFKQHCFAAMCCWTHCCHTLVQIDVTVTLRSSSLKSLDFECGRRAMVILDVKWSGVRWTQGGPDAVPEILNMATLIPYDKKYTWYISQADIYLIYDILSGIKVPCEHISTCHVTSIYMVYTWYILFFIWYIYAIYFV